jgi:hypothetical protein
MKLPESTRQSGPNFQQPARFIRAHGYRLQTCFPASALGSTTARADDSEAIVDGVDRRIGQALQRSCRPSGCRASARPQARPRSREAIAAISQLAACCIPGMTFRVPILAVLRTPQRIFDDMMW